MDIAKIKTLYRDYYMLVPLVPPPHLILPVLNISKGFHHMQDNHGKDMYAMERVLMGIFEQNDIYGHDPIADEIPVAMTLRD